jgi:peptidyl-prolyl cis-trans isomerase B (cyclophilin B)
MSNTRRPRGAYPARRQSTPRSTQVVVGVIALLCVAAVIALAIVLNGSGSTPAAAGGNSTAVSTPPSTTAPSTATSSSPPSGMDCTPAPAMPTKPLSFKQAPSPSLAQKSSWDAAITTNCGVIDVRLNGAVAPQTVSSFLFLAKKGYFDDSPCHRLTTSGLYVLQCGDPTGTGGGTPGYGFGIENAPKDGDFPTGTVAMARANSPNSNGSQFFIVYKDTKLPTTGGGYSIFAKVTKGLDIVKALARAGVTGGATDGAPVQPISILSVAVKKA